MNAQSRSVCRGSQLDTTEFLEGFEDVPLEDVILTGVTRSGA